MCPVASSSVHQEVGQQPEGRLHMFPAVLAAPSTPDSLLNHPGPQEEGRMGWGLGPGAIYMFLNSSRGADVGAQVTGSKSVVFSFFSPVCAGVSQPPVMEGEWVTESQPLGAPAGGRCEAASLFGSLNSERVRPSPQTRF